MKNDTRAGPGAAAFPATAWTQVLRARGSDADGARAALETVCRAYWPAIYTFLRALGCDREEAQDVTQDFLARFISEAGGLHAIAPEKGRLRSYLRQALRHHLINARRDSRRLKRGGGGEVVSLDDAAVFDIPGQPEQADSWFDRRWAWAVLRQAMNRVEAHCLAKGRGALLERVRSGLLQPDLLPPHMETAAALRMSEGQVKIEVHRLRRRLAEELRREVAATLDEGADVEAELRYLLAVLGEGGA